MTKLDFKYAVEFCTRYGSQVVKALKERAPVDTGALRADIAYKIIFYGQDFNLRFYIDDHIKPKNSKLEPSEYGYILDKHDFLDRTHGSRSTENWFTAPIPGLEPAYFLKNLKIAMIKDQKIYTTKLMQEMGFKVK